MEQQMAGETLWLELGDRLERLRPALLRLGYGWSSSWDDAEDLVQTALLGLLRSQGEAVIHWSDGRLFAYLRTAIRNGFMLNPRALVTIDDLAIEPADPALHPGEWILDDFNRGELRWLLVCALRCLPLDHRGVVLDWLNDHSWAHIAARRTVSVAAARQRRLRSLRAMRQFIETHREGPRPPLDYLSDDRVAEIAACHPSLSPELVREYCLEDWSEGEEHEQWLQSAPAAEIADWVLTLLEQ
jgi:DNA-directed RNA polymerase specialized sigma24 family protein